MQFNTWVSCDSSHPSLPVVRSPRPREEHIYLEDVQTDEEKLSGSMLSSESTFLPFTSDLEAQTTHTDSEDETETFEPDSLAPKRPAQPKKHKHSTHKIHESPTVDKKERGHEADDISGTATAGGSLEVRVITPQNDLETSSDSCKAEVKQQGEDGLCASKASMIAANRAAVKIQSWWRGQFGIYACSICTPNTS